MVTSKIDETVIPKFGNISYGICFYQYDVFYQKTFFNHVNLFISDGDILDDFIKEAHRHSECITYLFVKDNELIGFCSMSCASVFVDEDVINSENKNIIAPKLHPAIEFRYFAIAKKYWGGKFDGMDIKISDYIFQECLTYAFLSQKQ